MTIENNLLELDIFKSFIKKYEFPEGLKIKMIITNDIEEEYKKQLHKLNKQYDYASTIDYNGITCVPNIIDEDTVILINNDRVEDLKENNGEVVCTIFHELTHAKDYYIYSKNYCNGIYDSSKNRDSLYGFRNWSEFNAKKISYLEYCKLLHRDKINSIENLNNIKKIELPIKNKEIEELLKNKNSGIENVIYNLMFYLGRYSIWEDLFPNEFSNSKNFSKELIKYEPIVNQLYSTLKNNFGQMEDYVEIKKQINFFKGAWIVNSNDGN